MIVSVSLDTLSLAEEFPSLDDESIDNICDNIAKGIAYQFASDLANTADQDLHSTKNRYKNAIEVSDTGRLEGTVILNLTNDPVVRMIELGSDPWDMKEFMLNSRSAKVSKNGGRYVTIPFRVGTPFVKNGNGLFSRMMATAVYKIARKQVANIPTKNNSLRSEGLMTKDLPVQFQSPSKRAEIKDSEGKVLFKEYEHRSPLDQGLMKFKDSVTGQNRYGTFRRISEELISPEGKHIGSDPDSWINKGIEKHDLVSKTLSEFDAQKNAEDELENQLNQLGLL